MWWCEGIPCKKLGMNLIELLEMESPTWNDSYFLNWDNQKLFLSS